MSWKEIFLFSVPVAYLVVLGLLLAIPELIANKQPASPSFRESSNIFRNLPEKCAEVPTKVIGFNRLNGTVCYEGNGMFLEVGFEGMPDSIYIARVQPVKDSLREKHGGR